MNISVEDGPNSLYSTASLKVMHLLKQPTNADPPSIPDAVDYIAKKGRPDSGWAWRVSERSFALLNDCSSYEEVRRASGAALCRALQSVAIVNLCHDQLARSTPRSSLIPWATSNKARWHGQIVRYRPRLIVCGGTFDAVWQALGRPSRSCTTSGMDFFHDGEVPDCAYLDMSHPGAYFPLPMVLTYLIVGAREILAGGRESEPRQTTTAEQVEIRVTAVKQGTL